MNNLKEQKSLKVTFLKMTTEQCNSGAACSKDKVKTKDFIFSQEID
jgi:hypothetical protein